MTIAEKEEEVRIELEKIVKSNESSIKEIEKHRKRIKENKLKVIRLKNEVRNLKIVEEYDILLALDYEHFAIWTKLSYKYGLSKGTIKEFYYTYRTK